jgi:large subunit ribosomal protein L21
MSIFKSIIDVAAGLMGILFEKYEGSAEPETGTVTSQVDDLTQIDGIGPTFARRLEEAGITTYVQLAALSPEQAREITRVTVQSDPADWIAEANSLS